MSPVRTLSLSLAKNKRPLPTPKVPFFFFFLPSISCAWSRDYDQILSRTEFVGSHHAPSPSMCQRTVNQQRWERQVQRRMRRPRRPLPQPPPLPVQHVRNLQPPTNARGQGVSAPRHQPLPLLLLLSLLCSHPAKWEH